jgi:hypothetical protein
MLLGWIGIDVDVREREMGAAPRLEEGRRRRRCFVVRGLMAEETPQPLRAATLRMLKTSRRFGVLTSHTLITCIRHTHTHTHTHTQTILFRSPPRAHQTKKPLSPLENRRSFFFAAVRHHPTAPAQAAREGASDWLVVPTTIERRPLFFASACFKRRSRRERERCHQNLPLFSSSSLLQRAFSQRRQTPRLTSDKEAKQACRPTTSR